MKKENEELKRALSQMTAKRDILKDKANQSIIMSRRMEQLDKDLKKQSEKLFAIEKVSMECEDEAANGETLSSDLPLSKKILDIIFEVSIFKKKHLISLTST